MQNFAYIKTGDTYVVFIGSDVYRIDTTNRKYDRVEELLKQPATPDNIAEIEAIVTPRKAVENYTNGTDISVKGGRVYYKDTEEVNGTIVDRLLNMLKEGADVTALTNFLSKLYKNPSNSSIEELYMFLETNELPLTVDGDILAYKAVTNDYMDKHSRTFDNSIGKVVSVERRTVDDRRENTCSNGLHVARYGYADDFRNRGDRLVVVKIDPADVVSVPNDYGNAKMRVCKYEVIAEVPRGVESDHKETTTDVLKDKAVVMDLAGLLSALGMSLRLM